MSFTRLELGVHNTSLSISIHRLASTSTNLMSSHVLTGPKVGITASANAYMSKVSKYKRFLYSPINGTTPWEYGPCPSILFSKLSAYFYNPSFYTWNFPNSSFTVRWDHNMVYEIFVHHAEQLFLEIKLPKLGNMDVTVLKAGWGTHVDLHSPLNISAIADYPSWNFPNLR